MLGWSDGMPSPTPSFSRRRCGDILSRRALSLLPQHAGVALSMRRAAEQADAQSPRVVELRQLGVGITHARRKGRVACKHDQAKRARPTDPHDLKGHMGERLGERLRVEGCDFRAVMLQAWGVLNDDHVVRTRMHR